MAFRVKDHGTYFELQSLRQAFAPEVGVQGSCHFFGMKVVSNLHCASCGHREIGWCDTVLSDTQTNMYLPERMAKWIMIPVLQTHHTQIRTSAPPV